MSNIEKLLELAEKQLDQSATHDGLTNCDIIAKARAELEDLRETKRTLKLRTKEETDK